MSCSDWIMYIAYTSPPPRGCPITQSRKFFSIFTPSRTYFPAFTQSYKLVTFFHFHAITHIFFRFHAITQITQMRKGFSRHHAHQKDLSRITHTCQFHAISFSFSRNHSESRNRKGPFTQSRIPMGGLIHLKEEKVHGGAQGYVFCREDHPVMQIWKFWHISLNLLNFVWWSVLLITDEWLPPVLDTCNAIILRLKRTISVA